jgi:hypothetical protein
MSIYSDTGRFEYDWAGGRCHGCHKPQDFCRCEEWGGPKPVPEPKVWTVGYWDLGLNRWSYWGGLRKESAQFWAKQLASPKVPARRVAQEGSVRVLRRLRVIQTKCTCPLYVIDVDSAPRVSAWAKECAEFDAHEDRKRRDRAKARAIMEVK